MSFEGVFVVGPEKKMESDTLNLKWLPFESRLERSFAKANKLWFKIGFPIIGAFLAAQNNTENAPRRRRTPLSPLLGGVWDGNSPGSPFQTVLK